MVVGRASTIRNRSAWQRLWDHAHRALTPTPWPARVAVRLGASTDVAVEHHTVTVPCPLGRANALRVAFASDFHMGPNTHPRVIENAVAQLRTARADLLLGGDFVSLRAEYVTSLSPLLASIPAPFGRYAVLGNHDYWADGAAVTSSLQAAGIHVLKNATVRLADPYGNVSLCAIDDHGSGEPDAHAAFHGSTGVRIVLMHAPSGLLDIGERRFDVALCGHTHGGQIALPGGRPIVVAHGALSRRYNAGRYALDDGRTLLVSRGIGCGAAPFRYNAPAAVSICTVQFERTSVEMTHHRTVGPRG